MLNIAKGREPRTLLEHRLSAGSCYENMPQRAREDLKKALLCEQGFLCAYCMSRISESSMKVEHVRSRNEHPELALSHANMLACCDGGERGPAHERHCDTSKGRRSLSWSPARPEDRVQEDIWYDSDGGLHSRNDVIDGDADGLLNLNTPMLRGNRRAVRAAVFRKLASLPRNAERSAVERLLKIWEEPDARGRLPEHAGVAVFVLRRRLRGGTAA